jgi:hypothetical protein
VVGFQEGGLKLTFLIWDAVWQLQKVDISEWNTDVFGLSSCKAAGEVRVSEKAAISG